MIVYILKMIPDNVNNNRINHIEIGYAVEMGSLSNFHVFAELNWRYKCVIRSATTMEELVKNLKEEFKNDTIEYLLFEEY
jgi:hypothetical protein